MNAKCFFATLSLFAAVATPSVQAKDLLLLCKGYFYQSSWGAGKEPEKSEMEMTVTLSADGLTSPLFFPNVGTLRVPYTKSDLFYSGFLDATGLVRGQQVTKIGFSLHRVTGRLHTLYFFDGSDEPGASPFNGDCVATKVKF